MGVAAQSSGRHFPGFVPVAPASALRIPLVSVDDCGHPRWGPVQTDARQYTVPSCRIACLRCRQRPPGPTEPRRAWRAGCRRGSVPEPVVSIEQPLSKPLQKRRHADTDGFDGVTAFAASHGPGHEHAGFIPCRRQLSLIPYWFQCRRSRVPISRRPSRARLSTAGWRCRRAMKAGSLLHTHSDRA
jgi:hypothetical protein